ncbi:P63C domain-containing protein [Yersinia bercovieri]|uniref:P63C domain-containing protein n=1 Tax=Yersinia bercovieri TaxID=634 RepID=UPI0005E364D6|nr:P63C domain-containing protein [Yersinia bercovieri]CNJ10522.1 P63C domain [Yersinia bercovieri]
MQEEKKEPSGRARGGKARAEKLSAEERKASSHRALEARKVPVATHVGELKLGDITLQCAVLPGGQRLFSHGGVGEALTRVPGGKNRREMTQDQIPFFVNHKNVIPFIDNDLLRRIQEPFKYRQAPGAFIANGVPAEALPGICKAWQLARRSGALDNNEAALRVAAQAEAITLGFAQVGVIALIDEATGYQRDREKNALAKILEEFVAKELRPWVATFPAGYYEGLFKIYGLEYPPIGNKNWRPSFIGTVTNNVVYSRLAPELLPELKKAATKAERKTKLHQWLTEDIGHPKLREHLASIVTLLKISKTPEQFYELVDTVHPKLVVSGEKEI